LARVAAQALSLVIYVATGLLVLEALTIDIKPILGGAAIFGLAISFGSQSLVKDVVSGFFILLENQFAVGDVVNINSQSGTVEKITLRRTVLRDVRGRVHNITNGSISSVTNNTQGWARVVVNIGVAYGTDVEKVRDVVNRVGKAMYKDSEWRDKLTEQPTYVGVTAFGESEITIRCWFKTRTHQNWGAEREFNVRLKHAFEEANIEIPFPQRELRIVREVEVEKQKPDREES
jgi:small conductance mechanosensitive channel